MLKSYTDKRNITIVSMSKQLGIDRATLHKIISGDRRAPDEKFVADVCRLLMLSADETERMTELYRISVMGDGVYRRRCTVRDIIKGLSDMSWSKRQDDKMWTKPVIADIPSVSSVYTSQELWKRITALLSEEIQKGSEIRMIAQPSENLSNILRYAMPPSSSNTLYHMICLDNSEDLNGSHDYNLGIFPHICELSSDIKGYTPVYYYDNAAPHLDSMTLLPVLIVTDSFAVCTDDKISRGIIYNEPEAAVFYRRQFEDMRGNCYPLVISDNSLNSLFLKACRYPKNTTIIHYQPSFFYALSDEEVLDNCNYFKCGKPEKITELMGKIRRSFIGRGQTELFCEDGLKEFMETGIVYEFPRDFFKSIDEKKRKAFLKKMIEMTEKGLYDYRIVRKDHGVSGRLRINCLGGTDVRLMMRSDDFDNVVYVQTDEQSLVHAFGDYIDHLLEDGMALSSRETIKIMKSYL